jgi:hypothetical protein
MAVYKGNQKIANLNFGGTEIAKAYLGNTLVFSKEAWDGSYYILSTSSTKYHFNIENTPISNFNTSTNIIINNVNVSRANIREIHFGSSYSNVTSLPDYFLYYLPYTNVVDLSIFTNITSIGERFLEANGLLSLDLSLLSNVTTIPQEFIFGASKLTSIDLSPLSNVTYIYNDFMRNWDKLTSIDLSPLSKAAYVGGVFMYHCIALTNIQIGGVNWANKTVQGGYMMQEVPNTSACTLRANSQQLATNFKNAMEGNISNWTVIIN